MTALVRRAAAMISALVLLAAALPAAALDTPARAAIAVDLSSGAILMEKNADEALPPASMSKLMTLYMVFDALEEGRLSLDDMMPVSERAWRMGGSKMFVEVGDRIAVEDLLYGVTVQSGNDACIVLAEGLAGTEEAFAEQMNAAAREIGLDDSHFRNATGWPAENHVMSVRDLAILAETIVRRFPQHLHFFSTREFTWGGITQHNRNPLLDLNLGAIGMKTGHTEAAGYGLVALTDREGRRVVVVLAALDSPAARAVEAEKIVNWAYREFQTGVLFKAGEPIASAETWIADRATVGLAPAEDVIVTVPFGDVSAIRARVSYDGPLTAPIEQGQAIARLLVEAPGLEPVAYPLVATEPVAEGGVMARVEAAARLLLARSGASLPSFLQ